MGTKDIFKPNQNDLCVGIGRVLVLEIKSNQRFMTKKNKNRSCCSAPLFLKGNNSLT